MEESMTPFPKSQGWNLFQNIAFFKYQKVIQYVDHIQYNTIVGFQLAAHDQHMLMFLQ